MTAPAPDARPVPAPPEGLRTLRADNAGPYTLDGTRTFVVGRAPAAVIDPGPGDTRHIDAIARAAPGAATILLTHGHPDHAAGAAELARRTGASVRAAASGGLRDGDRIATDAGELVAVATPGHSPDHFAFHWPAAGIVFVGDLLLGGLDTALVAVPEGDLADYLRSLETVRRLRPRLLLPAHGPGFDDPDAALDAYVRHRELRRRQVLDALGAARRAGVRGAGGSEDDSWPPSPGEHAAPRSPEHAAPNPAGHAAPRSPDELVDAVYGPALPAALRRAAAGSIEAYLTYLEAAGLVRRPAPGLWVLTEGGADG